MRRFSWVFVALLIAGCGGGDGDQAKSTSEAKDVIAEQPAEAEAVAVVAVPPAQREVRCGCAVEGIEACGDYVNVDGKFLEIANWADMGLKAMEWCGQEGVHADTAGEIRDGKFYATTVAAHSH